MFTYQQVVQSRYPIKFHESWDFLHHKFHSHLSELQNLSSTKFQLFPNKNVHTSTRQINGLLASVLIKQGISSRAQETRHMVQCCKYTKYHLYTLSQQYKSTNINFMSVQKLQMHLYKYIGKVLPCHTFSSVQAGSLHHSSPREK